MASAKAIIVERVGGPEVLEYKQIDLPEPGPGEVLIRQTAIGLNFVDVYMRSGLYPMPLPFTPGVEAAGVVEAAGSDVRDLQIGDRVAYAATSPVGSYASSRVISAELLTRLPESISDEVAAAVMLKGCTVEYLVMRTYPVQSGDWVLWHAAAGGVGLLACQWLRSLGANLIGTVGSPEKVALAREAGCNFVIDYKKEDVVQQVRECTRGQGVDVVYDSVGRDTFEISLNCLRPRGMLVSFGNASGPVPPFAPLLLSQKGSLYLTRAGFKDYYAKKEERRAGTRALLKKIEHGILKVAIHQKFSLKDAGQAHSSLENRQTTGATVLFPE
ncbi:MAG: quinone oxidoreductase [Spirochaetales bacterium]|nr:quinone oxidoreductase [Spirochaetales bacterium]